MRVIKGKGLRGDLLMSGNPAICLALALALAGFQGAAASAEASHCGLSAQEVYERAAPSVVEVFSLTIDRFRVAGRVLPSFGSGFYLQDGRVATNYHVVADAQNVIIYDEEGAWDAMVVGSDPLLDIALLERAFAPDERQGLEIVGADMLSVGQQAFTIGFPLGLGKSISEGIVAGTGRVIPRTTWDWLSPMIQTDAAVNPGNSGGPLLDDCGRVLGMVSRSMHGETADNVGFAIPGEVLAPVLGELAENGAVARAWHGLYGKMVTPPILMILGVPFEQWIDSSGFLVETVEPGSAADRAGLQGGDWPVIWGGTQYLIGGDIITHVDGVRVTDLASTLEMVRGLTVGQEVTVTWRREGEQMEATVVLQERPTLPADLEQYRLR